MSSSETVPVSLHSSQVEQGAVLLAQIFQNDPMMRYFVTDHTRMLDKPLRFYQATIRMGLLYGEVHTTHSMDGVAVWVNPSNSHLAMGQFIRSGFLTAILSMGLTTLKRFMSTAAFFEELKKQTISEPHWVLVILGIEPSQQGKGLGGKLIAPILARADAEGMPCYLESLNERNLSFYERHGFEVATHRQIPKEGPQVWTMLREPGQQ